MTTVKQISFIIGSFLLVILLSSWGWRGHEIISANAPPSFPSSMSFLQGQFSTILVDSSTAADDRKQWDDSEASKHFIDIDNYPEFNYFGKIPQSWDSVVNAHGVSFVLDNGTIPWSTLAAYDSVKNCFARQEWDKAAIFAADLGHYVADGHNPLHLTANFDGGYTGQDGIHSRYESKMINAYYPQIVYPFDSVQLITNVQGYVFSYIYANYVYVDSVLKADMDATTFAGNNTSSVFYLAFWNNSKNFTIPLFHHASYALARLIYTAYVESQNMDVNEIHYGQTGLGNTYPNPARDYTVIPFDIDKSNTDVSVKIFDALGNIKAVLHEGKMAKGHHDIRWDTRSFSNGFYYCILEADNIISTKKLMLVH